VSHDISRRTAFALGAAAFAAPAFARHARHKAKQPKIQQWGFTEIALKGPADGNPFVDVNVSAVFENGGKSIEAAGFYDGDGVYRVRFMPTAKGRWQYRTKSNAPELDGKSGSFEAAPPSAGNHGPVSVANTYHFAYADGTPYRPFGTTSYVWTQQSDAQCKLTLKTLAASPFNKLRFAIFPNEDTGTEPIFPFEGQPKHWDFTRFNPAFFRRLENNIARLGELGIEADVILFHPYDHGKWGFDSMPAEVDHRYVRYVVARLAAYRHVWWSLANEYDDMKAKTDADFDRIFQVVLAADPYGHLRSIHHNRTMYNYNQPWVTHASVQNGSATEDDARAVLYRDVWRKPVVFDEVKYEGNVPKRWGNLSGEEMVLRTWMGAVAGTYVGHGESIEDAQHHMFLGEGGVFKGQSPARIAFFRKIVEAGPRAIDPIDKWQDRHLGGAPGAYYLRYFGRDTPTEWNFVLPKDGLSDGDSFAADIIDTWAMTITPAPGVFTVHKSGVYDFAAGRSISLPGKPWIALRIRKV
jgi:hypothetical protein